MVRRPIRAARRSARYVPVNRWTVSHPRTHFCRTREDPRPGCPCTDQSVRRFVRRPPRGRARAPEGGHRCCSRTRTPRSRSCLCWKGTKAYRRRRRGADAARRRRHGWEGELRHGRRKAPLCRRCTCADLDRAVDFYVGKLGLDERAERARRREGHRSGRGSRRRARRPRSSSRHGFGSWGPEKVAGWSRRIFAVEDVAGTVGADEAKGVETEQEPEGSPYGACAPVQDQDGNIFGLLE